MRRSPNEVTGANVVERLRGVNLNLLVTLEALLTEKNVTRAARRLGVSQPAASKGLAQLREILEDPLLVRIGGEMELSDRAEVILDRLGLGLTELAAVLDREPPFDPRSSERRFRIASTDYGGTLLAPVLMEHTCREAPGVGFDFRSFPFDRLVEEFETGALDAAIGPVSAQHRHLDRQALFRDDFVCVLRRSHSLAATPLTLEGYIGARHLLVSPIGRGTPLIDTVLASHGQMRRIAHRVAHFSVAPRVVSRSDLIATLPRRLAATIVDERLTLAELPFEGPSMETMMFVHRRTRDSADGRWLRETIVKSAASLG